MRDCPGANDSLRGLTQRVEHRTSPCQVKQTVRNGSQYLERATSSPIEFLAIAPWNRRQKASQTLLPGKSHRPLTGRRFGDWLPEEQHHVDKWLTELVAHIDANPQDLNPTLQAFKTFIEADPVVYLLFQQMFEEVPVIPPYNQQPTGSPQIRDYITMLRVFNVLMTRGPYWMYTNEGQKALIGFPFNAVLNWPMATGAGVLAFSRTDVNQHLRKMLDAWARYLASPASTAVLNSNAEGWFCSEALTEMSQVANEANTANPITFVQAYICDPSAVAYGYESWDAFFTRRFRTGVRPVASPNDARIICNACESSPYRIARKVKLRDRFWIKQQPYSLLDMLNHDPLAPSFASGTVYQAFLSALSYHRWHAPVTGTVVKVVHIPGTYFLQNYWQGFANVDPDSGISDPDTAAPNNSQAYLCQMATRSLIFIQADDPRIGLMAVLEVGMAEVSSCEVFVKAGQRVRKGEEIGTFHFGGSTHCLIFGPAVKLHFLPTEPFGAQSNLPVCSPVAVLTD